MKTSFSKWPVILAVLVLAALPLSKGFAQSIQPVYTFSLGPANPKANLTQGPDGNFYGTTYGGGSNGWGAVFEVTTNGVLTTLVNFASTNGAYPAAGLALGPDGNFYGTTYNGGISDVGTVFKVTTNGVLTMLVNFAEGANGAYPVAGLTLGPDGNFYGTTEEGGGGKRFGNVFEVTTNGIYSSLAIFAGTNGELPEAGLTLGPDGNFYGTTDNGGSNGYGTVFEVTTNGALTALYSFTATTSNGKSMYTNSDGALPQAGLTLGPDGNFYGTTESGGLSGEGTVFKVTTNGVLTSLYSFSALISVENHPVTNSDGAHPDSGLALGSDGNFYGTTMVGGHDGDGTVFEVTTNGVFSSLASFSGTNGELPEAGLTLGSDGNFYGTTYEGGSTGKGAVFEVTTNGVLTMVTSLGYVNGANPAAGLTLGPDGNFYGTTEYGGRNGIGTAFEVTASGALTTLASFAFTNGEFPEAGLTLGPDDNFYGTTYQGGSSGNGTVFQVTTNGALNTLHSFSIVTNVSGHLTNSDGVLPQAGLTLGPNGNFYGTAYQGGSSGNGTVFEVTTNGVLTTLHSFTTLIYAGSLGATNSDGIYPEASLAQGPDGNFYGTAKNGGIGAVGTVFEMTSNGVLTPLASFTGINGADPEASLTLGPDGNLYGTTEYGGSSDYGTVFEVTTNGLLTTLHSFTALINGGNIGYTNSDGAYPETGLALGPDGNFYGTTYDGGSSGEGTVFDMTTNGVLTTLASFAYTNGEFPEAGLTLGPDGNFYGTTHGVGNAPNIIGGVSEIFRLDLPPEIIRQPASQFAAVGGSINFSVTLFGTAPYSFQWLSNNIPITGGISSSLALSSITSADAGAYSVIVTNDWGSTTSSMANLTVFVQPTLYGIAYNPSSGSTTLSLASYPGSTNYLYATTNLTLPLSLWQLVATNVAGSSGLFQFTDPNTQGVPAKFYLLRAD